MMGPSVRTTAILMLLAGVSMGVFAGTLTAGEKPSVEPTLNQRIEMQVSEYRKFYGLDDVQTDQVRMILKDYQRQLLDGIRDVYRENQSRFDRLQGVAEKRIQDVVKKNGKAN